MTMAEFMRRFGGQTYALMRIVSGFLFLWHGTSKFFDFPKPSGAPEWIVYGAGSIELIGGVLIMIGLFTRWAAFIASGMAAVAYFLVHAKQGFFPILNGGELAAMYCFVFLYVSAHGAGIWSIDGIRGKSGG
jgi:putative oxidoreductase